MEKYRCSAIWHTGCGVVRTKVLFEDVEGGMVAFWMDREVYTAIPLGVKATPDDYRKFGKLDEAEDLDMYSNK